MGDKSAIQWCDSTWNCIVGCSHAGYTDADGQKRPHPGCDECYAEKTCSRGLHDDHRAVAGGGKWNGKVIFRPDFLLLPLQWKRARRIFVASLSDLGHPALPDEQRAAIYGVMLLSPDHTFQNLTKRPTELARFKREWDPDRCVSALKDLHPEVFALAPRIAVPLSGPTWEREGRHIHEIVSVSDQTTADALIPELLRMPAAVRGVSYEPAIGPVDFRQWLSKIGCSNCGWHGFDEELERNDDEIWQCPSCEAEEEGFIVGRVRGQYLDWVIVGGESGQRARPFDLAWARSVIEQCRAAGVPCFVKQLGARPFQSPTKTSPTGFEIRLEDGHGGDWDEWPPDLRVREFPT